MAEVMTKTYNGLKVPQGEKIQFSNGKPISPTKPIIPFIEGDGTGPDISRASKRVLDAAVQKAYKGLKEIAWFEVFAGEKAHTEFGEWLPDDTVEAICEFGVAIKGPLTTPVGGLGIAPGANIGDNCVIFEATHGTAPKYANKDVINPGSVTLSGVMMLEYLGWKEAEAVLG